MTNLNLTRLIADTRKCIESGTAEDFVALSPMLSNRDYGIRMVGSNDMVLDQYSYEFLEAYIRRYPEDFSANIKPPTFVYQMRMLLIKKLAEGDSMAYTIADILFRMNWNELYSPLLDISLFCDRLDFFEYCLDHIEDPLDHISNESIIYLMDTGNYDQLDRLFAKADKERVIKAIGIFRGPFLFDVAGSDLRLNIEHVCELADRYIPEVRDSADHAAAMSDFLEESGFAYNLCGLPTLLSRTDESFYFDAWKYMRENGLRFKNLSKLLAYADDFQNNYTPYALGVQEVLEERLIPIIDDQPYLSAIDLHNASQQFLIRGILHLFDIIRKSKDLYIDFCDRSFEDIIYYQGNNTPCGVTGAPTLKLKLKSFLKAGYKVRTEDDLAGSKAALSLIHSSDVLEYVLNSREYPQSQLNDLVELCIKNKEYDSLNVIRKLQHKDTSSNLKKKV